MNQILLAAAAVPLSAQAPAAWTARFHAACRQAADAGAQAVLFPEYVTAPLLEHAADWPRWSGRWRDTAHAAAATTGCIVVAGTHIEDGRNRALVAWPDGRERTQDKLHPTPWERGWGLPPTDALAVFDLAGVRAAITICYDVEFPELCRAAAVAGAELLLVPSWTDDAHGFHRVRRCAAARCVENALAVVHAPLVGGPAAPPGFEQAVGAAGVLTPCDLGFPPDGIAAAGGWNQPEVVVGAIDVGLLRARRHAGTVSPFSDRRAADGYRIG